VGAGLGSLIGRDDRREAATTSARSPPPLRKAKAANASSLIEVSVLLGWLLARAVLVSADG
jgi:hypothetical protein